MKTETRRKTRTQSHMPLDTDAWAFLNIKNPLCAWAAYRGSLLSPPRYGRHISIWYAAFLHGKGQRSYEIELVLERYRARFFADHISRLRGMFCFRDITSAERALEWGHHFTTDNLAELSTWSARRASGPYDANWITYANELEESAMLEMDWCRRYWSGEPAPNRVPIWETLIEGELNVLGTGLRERAYTLLKKYFPESLMLLEIGRMASWVGSRLGNVSSFLFRVSEEELECGYIMDMRDANNPMFLERLDKLISEGHPVNWNDMKPHIENQSFGRTMDLRRMHFRFKGKELPFDLSYDNVEGTASGRFLPPLITMPH